MTLSVQLLQIPATETVTKREFYLDADGITIGRDFACDICLPDLSEKISPTHIIIQRIETGSYSITGNSETGTILNGRELPSQHPQTLKDGDVVSFAGYKLMFGLVEKEMEEEAVNQPYHKFHVETDITGDDPLLPDQDVEETLVEPEIGFTGSDLDLEQDLMFDPFAEGPEMREEAKAKKDQSAPMRDEVVEVMDVAAYEANRQLHQAPLHNTLQREKVSAAMEKAIERFLEELDPSVLKEDYDDFIPRLVSREKRYWRIHARQFARKKASGQFRRSFMALFAEEMRKL